MAVSPPQWDNLPTGLKELRHWLLWKMAERDDKPTKVPIRADSGLPAEADNQTTWSSYENAKDGFEKGRGGAVGIGFVFARSSKISGVDLDHCRDPDSGVVDQWAADILGRLPSYTEISPSGAGLHVLVKGTIPITGADGGRKKALKGEGYKPGAAIEMYSNKRFFTMTGNVLPGYPQTVEDRQDELTALYNEIFGPVKSDGSKAADRGQDATRGKPVDQNKQEHLGILDKIKERMFSSANGPEILKLYNGDISAYGGDDSAADLALCNHLAFYCNKNPRLMEALFRQSKLMRDKWDEARGATTYGHMTIVKAIADTTECYQGDEENNVTTVVNVTLPDGVRRWSDKLPPEVPGVDQDGITYHREEKKMPGKDGKPIYTKAKLCDGFAVITEETRDDQGEASFTIEGRGSQDKHEFKFDITGRDFSDNRKLKAALTAHFGARNRVKQLTGDIIQSLTLKVNKLTLVTSPRWINGKLAIPGLDDDNQFKFRMLKRVPVDLSTGGDEEGLAAVKLMFEVWPREKAAITIAADLASPVCGRWFAGDRFGIALVGTTGRALKTEALKHLLAVYGGGFLSEDALLRWGEGATLNAMLSIVSGCGCLPAGIDNYKATSRDSAGKFVSVVHTVLEGRERERLNRNAELRETREYASTLFVTGEDLPEEASTVARLLPLEWGTADMDHLTELQKIAHHLPAIGRVWCRYLSESNGVDMDRWRESRSQLVKAAEEAGAVNPGRIGTTAAILKLVWSMALDSPLGVVLKDYTGAFERGLASLMLSTAQATTSATEAAQFVDTLKEIIVSGRGYLLHEVNTGMELTLPNIIGWKLDKYGTTAILPKVAIEAVRRVTGPQAQSVGANTLYRQLEEAGYIEVGEDQRTIKKRAGTKTVRVLVFKAGVLQDDGLDKVDLTKSADYAAEDIRQQREADAIALRLKKAVSVG